LFLPRPNSSTVAAAHLAGARTAAEILDARDKAAGHLQVRQG
jgi:hypothetical protein